MGCVLFDPKTVALSGETSDIKTSPQGLKFPPSPPHVKGFLLRLLSKPLSVVN